MLSTVITFQSKQYQVTSRLLALLRERGRTQKDLAKATGFTTIRIHRLAHQTTVRKIVCATAVKICFVLSKWKRRKDGRRVRIRFDDLFQIESV